VKRVDPNGNRNYLLSAPLEKLTALSPSQLVQLLDRTHETDYVCSHELGASSSNDCAACIPAYQLSTLQWSNLLSRANLIYTSSIKAPLLPNARSQHG